jgi:hypothetical protein
VSVVDYSRKYHKTILIMWGGGLDTERNEILDVIPTSISKRQAAKDLRHLLTFQTCVPLHRSLNVKITIARYGAVGRSCS